MKKAITKLVLRRETVRWLVDAELKRAAGGDEETGCTTISRFNSGCPLALAPEPRADPT
jgi:hypothetical protein